MKNIGIAIVVVLGIFAVCALVGAFGGLIFLALWNLFHLAAIVHLTYWQAVGVYWLFVLPISLVSANINILRGQLVKKTK